MQTPSEVNNPSVLEQMAQDRWNKEVMACAVAAKKESREQKGLPFNCFVLERKDPGEGEDELVTFMNKLKANLNTIEYGTRFQLAILAGTHWTACDLMIEKGSIKIFCLDSLNHPVALKHVSDIDKLFPTMTIHYYDPDEIDDERERIFQFDKISCSRFTLDHLYKLSQIPIYEEFSRNIKAGKIKCANPITDPNFYRVDPKNCPPSLAAIFRDTQSWTILNSLPEALKNTVINRKGETLLESATKHTGPIKIKGEEKDGNLAIIHKKDSFSQKIIDYIKTHKTEEIHAVINNRQGYQFLESQVRREVLQKPDPTKYSPLKALQHAVGKQIQEQSQRDVNAIGSKDSLKMTKSELQVLMHISNSLKAANSESDALKIIEQYQRNLPLSIMQKLMPILETFPDFNAAQFRRSSTAKTTLDSVVNLLPNLINKLSRPDESKGIAENADIKSTNSTASIYKLTGITPKKATDLLKEKEKVQEDDVGVKNREERSVAPNALIPPKSPPATKREENQENTSSIRPKL